MEGSLKNKTPRVSIIYLAALSGFGPFATDIYLASMPTIQRTFETSTTLVQLTLSLFFISLAIGQLLWGPISDRMGRKSTSLLGVIIFISSSLFCAWSENITTLIVARIFQALGAAATSVSAMAMVRDTFSDGKSMSKALGQMMGIIIIAPIIAPIIGGYLLAHIGWQSNFYFLALYGAGLLISTHLIPETHPKAIRKPLPTHQLAHAYWHQLKFTPFLFAVLAASTNFSVMFAFISASAFIYIDTYQLPVHLFGYFYAMNAGALILGTQSLSPLKKRVSNANIVIIALILSSIGIIAMFAALLILPPSTWSVAAPMLLVTYGVGILFPELTSHSLSKVIHHTGIASALAGTLRFVVASIVGLLVGHLLVQSALPLAWILLVMNAITGILMYLYFRIIHPNKRRSVCSSTHTAT